MTNEDRSKDWIERQIKRYADNRYGRQAIIEKKTNLLVGLCGLISQDVEERIEIEVGYHIFKRMLFS